MDAILIFRPVLLAVRGMSCSVGSGHLPLVNPVGST